MLDIVIPFYNDYDEHWRTIMYDYMAKEGSNDRQVVGEERYRDWDCFKYFFRCIEKNCKWVNKVFLIVADESQVPDWVNKDNPKLRIVYHRDYIPEELLPTFNIMTIEDYICNIEDLADNYVYCNDDYYFLNETPKDLFMVGDYLVFKNGPLELKKIDDWYLNGSDGTFYKSLNNGIDLQLEINGDKAKWYAIDHIPVVHNKTFEKDIINKYYDRFINANKESKFRCGENISNHVFTCLYKDTKPYFLFNNYNSCYVTVRKETDFNIYDSFTMVCFNDTQQLSKDDFMETKNKMVKFFENKFPGKSSFEK